MKRIREFLCLAAWACSTLLYLSSCQNAPAVNPSETPAENHTAAEGSPQPASLPAGTAPHAGGEAVAAIADAEAGNKVVLDTTQGKIVIELLDKDCPLHAANFKSLVAAGYFKGQPFHRVAGGYFAQAGDKSSGSAPITDSLIPAEIGHPHVRGAVAGAFSRDDNNPAAGSLAHQFFICIQDLPDCDGKSTVFGRVTEGLETVEKLKSGEIASQYLVAPDQADRILDARIVQ